MKALLRATVTVATLAAFTCPGESRVSAIELFPRGEHRYAELDDRLASVTLLRGVYVVGDSDDIAAFAIAGNDYLRPAYTSRDRPGEFAFVSTAPSVASIATPGIIKALAPGEARITVAHLGFIDTLRIVVLPRISALRVIGPSTAIRAGESAAVTLEALDQDARPVPQVFAYLDTYQPAIVSVREGSLIVHSLAAGTAIVSARVIGQDVRATTSLTVAP